MSSVVQDWMTRIPWKSQSIFLNGLRAPDVSTKAIKKAVRWMRLASCNNADPLKADCYMSAPPMTAELIEQIMDELEYLTCHYVHHFADAMRVLALFHPDERIRQAAHDIHFLIAEEIFHFKPETDEEFLYRHRDRVSTDAPSLEPSPIKQ